MSTCSIWTRSPGRRRATRAACHECLASGGQWVHLRRCAQCGHVGCCDNSPGKHATGHFHAPSTPRSSQFLGLTLDPLGRHCFDLLVVGSGP